MFNEHEFWTLAKVCSFHSLNPRMDRLKERENVLKLTLKSQYGGQIPIGSPSWNDLQSRISIYFETFETVTDKLKRQKKPEVLSIADCKHNLILTLEACLTSYKYPVAKSYQEAVKKWLHQVIHDEEIICVPYDLGNFVFKTYYLTDDLEVTCLEEVKKMSNSEATTGLITWQGALGMHQYISGQDEFCKFQQILELGSGAGLLGLSLLKSMRNIESYTFTDISPTVLDTINANLSINYELPHEVENWILDGAPEIINTSNLYQNIQRRVKNSEGHEQQVNVRFLDWLNASDELLKSIDYDVIIGSDLTYTISMLLPLAELLKRLLKLKEKHVEAWIACTQRGSDSIAIFLTHLKEVGLEYSLASQFTLSLNNVISHEPLHKVFIYKIQCK